MIHAFTDGSCLAPTCKLARVATWRVVIADQDLSTYWPLSSGTVPGQKTKLAGIRVEQGYALYEFQTGLTGMRHVKTTKQWIDGSTDVRYIDFVRRTNYFSDWVQGVLKAISRTSKLLHVRPIFFCLQFRTQCVCLRIRNGVLQRADDILMMTQPKVNSVKALRSF